jgi:hypothetical protein
MLLITRNILFAQSQPFSLPLSKPFAASAFPLFAGSAGMPALLITY